MSSFERYERSFNLVPFYKERLVEGLSRFEISFPYLRFCI